MKNKTTLIVSGVIVIIIVLALVMSGRKNSNGNSFHLGLISILSGDYAAVGENFKNGVVLADEQYNASHPDAPIKLTIEDDGFSGGKGVSAYEKLVSVDKIDALINVSTPTIDSIYEKVVQAGLPVIQGGEQGREPTDDNVFGIYPDSIASEYDYGTYMKNKGIKNMNLVYANIPAMIRFAEAFKNGFQGSTTDFLIEASEKDFRTQALKVAENKVPDIGLFMVPQQGAQFMKEYLKVSKTKTGLFFDTNFVSGEADYERILGGLSQLNGAIVGAMKIDTTDAFKVAYKARFGTDAGFLADIGYDSFNVMAKTYSSDKTAWVKNIKTADMDGASGNIRFGATGNRTPATKMMVIKDGKLVDLQ